MMSTWRHRKFSKFFISYTYDMRTNSNLFSVYFIFIFFIINNIIKVHFPISCITDECLFHLCLVIARESIFIKYSTRYINVRLSVHSLLHIFLKYYSWHFYTIFHIFYNITVGEWTRSFQYFFYYKFFQVNSVDFSVNITIFFVTYKSHTYVYPIIEIKRIEKK